MSAQLPGVIEGSYEGDHHRIDYWSVCLPCPQRKDCQHDCDTPGWIKFYRRLREGDEVDPEAPEGWFEVWMRSGIITLKSVKNAVKEAFEAQQMRLF